ncbi:integrase family protein [Anaeromyxobacter dehalogenans 2CP-1]|uniref:Integrase family protein n=1 Tax=Anaeromyxobacter dehalogenans (strain ATCC BAA-258 / DSM 21875 / 2CP-1) TaxID=455488 RepID=B8JGG2_ANAD2|nr:tyrosine-type recombinase/integrase [Anaeromyxobacter dehalogenans]ACL64633.1 integrase family protein [Anaeromyxobacter dehalogenans 2CP-1]
MAWERWSGGRIWVSEKTGRRTFYGEVNGRMVSTHRENEQDALIALLRMNTGGGSGPQPPLNDIWVEEYLADCGRRGIDPQSINTKRRHLAEWNRRIGPQRITLPVLNKAVKRLGGARNKVATIKAYFTWLRQQGRVRRQDDPTLDLAKPSAPPCEWDRLVPIDHHRKVVAELEPRWGDLLVVLSGTGWHLSELLRFARSGSIDGNVLVCPRHKSGEPHRTMVSDAVLGAAQRSRERGGFSPSLLYRTVAATCDRLCIPRFGVGGYRHTVATNAVRSGASPEEVAHFLGHKGSYMVKAIYAKVAVPKKIPTLQ